jgi:hypothetical protein
MNKCSEVLSVVVKCSQNVCSGIPLHDYNVVRYNILIMCFVVSVVSVVGFWGYILNFFSLS